MPDLDIDLLRTFVAIVEVRSFTGASQRLCRTQSSVSLKLKRLEDQLGGRLLHRVQGRVGDLTALGGCLFDHATELLRVHDRALAALEPSRLEGHIHLGIADDTVHRTLSPALARLQVEYPRVEWHVACASSGELEEWLAVERIDLALVNRLDAPLDARLIGEPLRDEPLAWVHHSELSLRPGQPLPLVAFANGCGYQTRALEALNAARYPWRAVYTSNSRASVWGAVGAGLGVAALPLRDLPSVNEMFTVDTSTPLPALKPVHVSIVQRVQDAGDSLSARVCQRLREQFLSSDPLDQVSGDAMK
ncbi:MAG: LysR family transcriptional regulator [Salinicola sp.]|uniref:LysR substrate-binding domain-containing protein n=1 Tax=Salinicola sp. TaxID=1978524 RepID=UPI001D492945|nr:LysR substrate-binding domain-containing protein [Salinicola sp.]NRB54582.1 LysR family transcriptional regulator [Salinicola sp.]